MNIIRLKIDRFLQLLGVAMKTRIMFLVILFGFVPNAVYPMGLSPARAVAMGGAYTGLAKGVYAPLYNPANIGLSGYQEIGIELVGVGAELSNNSFTLDDYNDYTDVILTEEDKSTILGKIPAKGLKVTSDIEVSLMSLSMGPFVLSLNGNAAAEVNLGKDALELFMEENALVDTFSLDGRYNQAIAYASAGLSYGTSIYKSGTRQLAVGATFKYIRGLGYGKVTELSGSGRVDTLMPGYEGEGTMIAQTATGGSGYAVDIGTALKLSDSYTAGVAFINILSSITWDKDTEEHRSYFQFNTIETLDDIDIEGSDEDPIEIPSFKSNLPTVMKVGLANISGKLLWAVDWEQGFKQAAGVSSKPRLSAGAEYRLIGFLPLRAGYSIGGGKGSVISGGLGFDLSLFYLDLAVSNHGGFNFGEKSKGIHLAVSTGLRF